jgi:hypothetical protein
MCSGRGVPRCREVVSVGGRVRVPQEVASGQGGGLHEVVRGGPDLGIVGSNTVGAGDLRGRYAGGLGELR